MIDWSVVKKEALSGVSHHFGVGDAGRSVAEGITAAVRAYHEQRALSEEAALTRLEAIAEKLQKAGGVEDIPDGEGQADLDAHIDRAMTEAAETGKGGME